MASGSQRRGRTLLTAQGRGLLAGGLTAALCGVVLGERDLIRIGLVIAALPAVAMVWVRLAARNLHSRRQLHPGTIEVGGTSDVRINLTHKGLVVPDVLVRDTYDRALGSAPRLAAGRLRAGRPTTVTHSIEGRVRGVFEIGPMSTTTSDPFGLAECTRVSGDVDELTVTPHLCELQPTGLSGQWGGAGDIRPRTFAMGQAADVAVREYRTGDDLRRVHWRSTARTGELMVRREEQPWQSRCTLVLDNRAHAHRGSRVDSTLELAISAAGSIAVHLADLGYQVRLVTATGHEVSRGWHDSQASLSELLRELAVLTSVDVGTMDTDWIDESTTHTMVIGVFGELHSHDADFLSRLRSRGTTNRALQIDLGGRGGNPATSSDILRAAGWRSVLVDRLEALPWAWRELSQ